MAGRFAILIFEVDEDEAVSDDDTIQDVVATVVAPADWTFQYGDYATDKAHAEYVLRASGMFRD